MKKWFLKFLRGFVPAFILEWFRTLRSRQAEIQHGAELQQEAEKKQTDQLAREAEGRAQELDKLSGDELRDRADK